MMYMYKDIVSGWNLRNQMSPTFHIGIQEFEEFTAPTRILPQPWCLVQKPRSWRISWGLSRLSNLQNLKIWCYYIYIYICRYIYIYISLYVISLLFLFHVFSVLWSQISQRKKHLSSSPWPAITSPVARLPRVGSQVTHDTADAFVTSSRLEPSSNESLL